MIDTVTGAKDRAIIYSIAEIAKANGLKMYDDLEYLLTEITKHLNDKDRGFLDDLLPWPPYLPANCRESGKRRRAIKIGANLFLSYRFAPILYRYGLSIVYIYKQCLRYCSHMKITNIYGRNLRLQNTQRESDESRIL